MHSIAHRRVTLRTLAVLAVAAVVGALLVRGVSGTSGAQAEAASPIRPAGADTSFTTVFKSTLGIEGLTGDRDGTSTRPDAATPARSRGSPPAAGRRWSWATSRRHAAPPG